MEASIGIYSDTFKEKKQRPVHLICPIQGLGQSVIGFAGATQRQVVSYIQASIESMFMGGEYILCPEGFAIGLQYRIAE